MFLIGKSELLMGDKLPAVGVGGCVMCVCAHAGAHAGTQVAVMTVRGYLGLPKNLPVQKCLELEIQARGVAEPWWGSRGWDKVDSRFLTRAQMLGSGPTTLPSGTVNKDLVKYTDRRKMTLID